MNSDGARALHAIFCQEGKSQDNLRASESLNKDMVCRRKFRRSRTFVEKDGSIQVTRLWKENYDFSLDSKFTNDSKDKTVTRALHGPWDFSIQDTNEQVQLIVHMWIGLFYSRSTARFFHFDSSLPCLEGNDFLEMSSETVPAQTTPDPKTSSSAPVPAKMPESKDVDLNIKETPVLIQESVVLDLSLRNPRTPDLTSDTQVNRKELPAPDEQTDILKSSQELEPSLELCESSTSCLLPAKNQPVEICREKADVLDKITKLDDDRSSNKSHNTSNLQKTSNLEHSDAVSCKKSGGTSTVLCEEMENVCILQENVLGTQETVHVLERSNNQKTEMRDCNENPGTAEGELVRQVGIDSSKIIVHEEILKDSNCDFANLIHPVECDENDINDGDHVKPIDKPHQKDNVESSLPAMRVNDTTNDETAAVGDVNLLKNDTRPTMQAVEESEALSLGQDEKVHEDKDRHPVNDCSVLGDEVHIGMIDGADLKDQSPTVVHTGSDFSDKALPKLYDGHGSREDKLIAECTGNISLAEKPPQVDNEKEAYNTSLLEVQCANEEGSTDEKTMPAQDHNSALETLPTECGDVSVDEATSGMIDDIHSRDEVLSKKAAYPVCDKNTPTLDESTRAIPRSVDDIVGESLNEVKSDLSVLSSSDSEDKDTRLIESERKVDNHTPEITSITQQWQPSQGETSETPNGQIEIPLIGEADFGQDIASTQISLPKDEISESMHNHVEIPLIGIEAPWQETLHTQVSQNNTQEVVQDQKEIPLIRKSNDSASIVHTELDNTSQEKSEKAPLCAGKFIGFVHSDSNQKMVSKKRKSDNRCPTPTVDEKPYDDISCPNHFSSISASGGNNGVCKIFTGRELSRSSTPTQDELPLDQERNDSCTLKNILLPEPRVNNSLNLHCDLTLGKEQVIPDHELRTIRSLSPTEKQLCKSSHMTESRHFETTEMHIDQEQAPNPSNKPISTNSPPSHWSTSYSKGDKVDDNSCVASTSTKHQLHTKSVPNTLNSSRKLALKETDRPTIEHYLSRTDGLKDISLEQDSSISSDSMFNTAEFVRAVINQARGRATIQDNVPHEIHSHSQRPVMAVRPSKSDESGADYIFKEGQGYSSMTSDVPSDKPTKVAVHTHTTPSATILSRQTDRSSGVSEDINEQENTESCSKENWVSDDQDVVRRFNLDQAKLDLISVYQYQETDEQSEIGQTAEDWIEINEEDPQVVMSALVLDYKEKGKTNDVGPSTSPLKRTVYNSSSKGSKSLVDQPSERCSESDLTQSSMEQESLIFSERMSQLMKRNRRGTSYFKTNKYGRSKHCRSETTSCPSPVTVCFSSLREQEDSVEHWEALPSIVGQKIKVDMPERRGLAETAGGEKTLHPHKLSYGKGNPMAHAVVSDMTAGCARSYHAMMDDVCAGKKLPSKTVYPKMESSFSKVGASNHVDFSGQMKREMYDNLHSNLNSVVRQSCKTKFRFYILVTSADTFFEETKELLKGEGHTEVQPSQFFLGEESSSPLLIILRNEDIAEHICEVPHLLELKKSPGVLFAGIDQPDDIVSLTHQELFSRGGFVVFEGAALETLSLCNMKRISQFLEELSKKGRWKWLLHYRDSRHLKENARLTAEAMEKKRFIDCCQEAGMVEVLPYHECDIMSRDRPNYLNCLVRLQVQNISARYPVFITDTTADGAYGKNGILTMNINSFLLISESDTCTIS